MKPFRPINASAIPCKICGKPAPLYGSIDFNRCCRIPGAVSLPPANLAVSYHRCQACGFLFTDAFDDWSESDYKAHIYNDGYLAVDPEYAEVRPRNNADAVIQLFGQGETKPRVLDYGGGNDVLCSVLRAAGFPLAVTYDPFVPEHAIPPVGKYDLVTCFETLEHMPDPLGGIGAMLAYLDEPGLLVFSTLLQPQDFHAHGMNWWYVGPRNGHISMFSKDALFKAFTRYGYKTGSFNDNLHAAFRTWPEFAKHLLK
jgi:2-polyprenyl-6-hydroxyphenyl methylase/3-demethylubiquinone-9 3-methyltransferase